ncbi:imidazole glycerol phosphate synthase subunit HisH [Noviherbaspirillum sp. CPCC 100848]|uniref:Imidazole glycerol phosphate synthase subunit HisH n=1 Tax=Noviherbaspirillum album TaxID=3080276 RepID=A0ABU6JCH2_9BURK|nr:imidazole glycerol phosphate synthase subunit HisH [Noviherbaspirillum sp. CPCC 100848]MEC4721339.1 imidazole glycerol phosphate synthase subunit HisH [Noviherbaspirillum sp. CPCC 100848]
MKNIVILDYGLGNVRSVTNALSAVGANPLISNEESALHADGLIIPGVGAFPHAMERLKAAGLVDLIHRFIENGKPVLGICLGMQLLFEKGSEFVNTEGLGIIVGSVDRISIPYDRGRLPHIAWSKVVQTQPVGEILFSGLNEDELRFYFVHSYAAAEVPTENIIGLTTYMGQRVVAAVRRGNVWGTQFHPEKSGRSGLQILKNFVSCC